MASRNKRTAETPFDYVLESAIVSSSKFIEGATIELKNIITDIEIYEHLDKPYLTGNVIIVDDSNMDEVSQAISDVNFLDKVIDFHYMYKKGKKKQNNVTATLFKLK